MSERASSPFPLFLILALVMAITRFGHGGSTWSLPDASWAVFFVAGFYLRRHWRWALLALLVEAVVIDFVAIRYYGISNYCVTPAYAFILPGYSALWLGGAWLRRHHAQRPGDLAKLAVAFVLSMSACFLITEASFYWLGTRVGSPSFAGWCSNVANWYGYFLGISGLYVAFAALVHTLVTQWMPVRASVRSP